MRFQLPLISDNEVSINNPFMFSDNEVSITNNLLFLDFEVSFTNTLFLFRNIRFQLRTVCSYNEVTIMILFCLQKMGFIY